MWSGLIIQHEGGRCVDALRWWCWWWLPPCGWRTGRYRTAAILLSGWVGHRAGDELKWNWTSEQQQQQQQLHPLMCRDLAKLLGSTWTLSHPSSRLASLVGRSQVVGPGQAVVYCYPVNNCGDLWVQQMTEWHDTIGSKDYHRVINIISIILLLSPCSGHYSPTQ